MKSEGACAPSGPPKMTPMTVFHSMALQTAGHSQVFDLAVCLMVMPTQLQRHH